MTRLCSRDAMIALRWALPFMLSTFVFGVTFGVVARQLGLTAPWIINLSASAFSGTAQLTALQLWSAATPTSVIVGSVLAINSRYLAMGATLRPLFSQQPRWSRYAMLFLLTDAGWSLTLRAAQEALSPVTIYLCTGIAMYLSWIAGATVGASATLTLDNQYQLAAKLFAICMLASLVPQFVSKNNDWLGVGVGVMVAFVAKLAVGEAWAVILGGLCGATAKVRFQS